MPKVPIITDHTKKLDLYPKILRSKLTLPLKPIWIARSLHLSPPPVTSASQPKYHPIYLCTASKFQSSSTEEPSTNYVQGAGDDNESWSRGLTSAVYWANREALLTATEDELPELIRACMGRDKESRVGKGKTYSRVPQAPWLRIGTLPESEGDIEGFGGENVLMIACASKSWTFPGLPSDGSDQVNDGVMPGPPGLSNNGSNELDDTTTPPRKKTNHLHLHCGPGKLGSKDLRKQLLKLAPFLAEHFHSPPNTSTTPSPASPTQLPALEIIICCETGKDLSVGVALALLCLYTNDTGIFTYSAVEEWRHIDKTLIKRKLGWIVSALPGANPARATLNSVNAFLMS